ncbi:MAG TPA: Rieske (2Fe-2S) protein [Propionicimonas sp.]|nr:Rieske (2Fe-2S) protein [Propionicimonas sp.]
MTSKRVSTSRGDASRRAVMGGLVGLGVGVPLLSACGSDDSDGGDGGGGSASGPVGKTSEVPVGSGKIFAGDKVVVTQPTEGEFKAFSAVCTHQGCVVANIKGADINCTCHGSKFSTADGSVVNGPATKPLEELKVTVEGEDLTVS